LQSVLIQQGAGAALVKLNELVRVSGVADVLIGWTIVDLLRKAHDAARLMDDGQNDFAISKQLKLWGDAQALVCRAARALGSAGAAALLAESVRTDARTKSGLSSDSARTFEALVVTIGDRIR
jgi:DNA polymerase III delta subunit